MEFMYKVQFPKDKETRKVTEKDVMQQFPELKPLLEHFCAKLVHLTLEVKDGYIDIWGRPLKE